MQPYLRYADCYLVDVALAHLARGLFNYDFYLSSIGPIWLFLDGCKDSKLENSVYQVGIFCENQKWGCLLVEAYSKFGKISCIM